MRRSQSFDSRSIKLALPLKKTYVAPYQDSDIIDIHTLWKVWSKYDVDFVADVFELRGILVR